MKLRHSPLRCGSLVGGSANPQGSITKHRDAARKGVKIGGSDQCGERIRNGDLRYLRLIPPAVYCSAETSNPENSPKSFVEVIDQDVWQPTSLFAE